MTQTGHTPARRGLVAGAGASRSPAQVSRHRPLRLAPQPTVMQDLRGKAHVRRCQRSHRLVAQGKQAHGVPGAIARARVGVGWAIAKEGPRTLSCPLDHLRAHSLVGNTVSKCAKGLPRGAYAPGTFHRPRPRAYSIEKMCPWTCAETPPRLGVTLGGVQRAHGHPRPSMEAGTRRRQGRWYPTHGEPQDQPSSLPGSASLHAQRCKQH